MKRQSNGQQGKPLHRRADKKRKTDRPGPTDTKVKSKSGRSRVRAGATGEPRAKPKTRSQKSGARQQAHSQSTTNEPQKIHKLLAEAGITSRREANRMLEAGRFTVDGEIAPPWMLVTGNEDIRLDGITVKLPNTQNTVTRILILNKSQGQICTRYDPEGRPLVFDQLPEIAVGRWVSVGRLDFNTTGLLLFTNDGGLANKLMHPSSNLDREYAVRILGRVTKEMLARLREGVMLEDGIARFSDVQFYGGAGANKWYHVTLMEGRKHEVRRLWESQGVKVSRLKRVRFGPVIMHSRLSVGKLLELQPAEVAALCRLVGVKARTDARQSSSFRGGLRASKVLIAYPGLSD